MKPGALVLASTSKARKALLRAAGIPYRAVAPQVEERVPEGLSAREAARMLAHLKAEAVARRLPEKLVVGSDQVLELEGRVLRKPRDRREARRQIRALAGRVHWLHTAVALYRIEPKLRRSALESVALRVRPMGRREIEAYLDTNEWQGCAGGYRVEGQGIKLLESVRGDYHAVVGLPMLRLIRMLRDAGFALF